LYGYSREKQRSAPQSESEKETAAISTTGLWEKQAATQQPHAEDFGPVVNSSTPAFPSGHERKRGKVQQGGGGDGSILSCFDRHCPSPWLDTQGRRIEAHGGGLLSHGGKLYWYGEGAKQIEPQRGYGYSDGVTCYSSVSGGLAGPWRSHGVVLAERAIPASPPELPQADRPFILERPKVIYNERTQMFVMWFHLDAAELIEEAQLTNWHRLKHVKHKYVYRRAGVAVSESVTGPFAFVHALQPDGEKSLDLQLWQEEGGERDGPAFLVRSVNNKVCCGRSVPKGEKDKTGRMQQPLPCS
jgi:hypothetical protein